MVRAAEGPRASGWCTLDVVTDKRREARYPARIVARVVRRSRTTEFLTNDVSFRGVFIRTDAPPQLRQLVRVELILPTGVVVQAHAMVVHVAPPPAVKGEGIVPGIGLQFWGPIEKARDWETFIHDLRNRHRAGIAAAKATDKVRRASERFKLALEVVLGGETAMTRDLSENGMAIRTETKMPVGMRAVLELRGSEGSLRLDIIVRRQIQEPDFRGLGVELVDVSPEARAALDRLLFNTAPSEDRIFVPPGDPKLH
jgi:hypothetical protein